MFEEKIIKKVPGILKPNPKESQGYIEDLSTKAKVELLELLERQDNLLANKDFISKLPDKGKRVKSFQERLVKELKKHDVIEETCDLLSNLSLEKNNVNDDIEWNRKYSDKDPSDDSDDSYTEVDPLKIIVSHSGVEPFKKKSRTLMKYENLENDGALDKQLKSVPEEHNANASSQCEEGIIENLEAASTDSSASFLSEVHANNLCKKIDSLPEKTKVPYKPHCTTKSGLHPGLHTPKHLGPHWEVTAATPPPPVHGAVKPLSLQESLLLQQHQAAKLKDIQAKHAAERLTLGSSLKLGPTLPSLAAKSEYRDVPQTYDSSSSSDEEDNEGQNDGDDDNRDTIVYTYTE